MHWTYPFRFLLGLNVLTVKAILKKIKGLYWTVYAHTWDIYLNIDNWLSRKRDPRQVIPPGAPGFMGKYYQVNLVCTPPHPHLTRLARRLVDPPLLASSQQ